MNVNKGAMKDFKQRIGMSLIFLVLLCLFIGFSQVSYFKPIFVLAVAAVGLIALWEYFQIVKAKGMEPAVKISMVGSFIYFYAVFASTLSPHLNYLPAAVLGFLFTVLFVHHFNAAQNALSSIATSFFGIIYIVVTLAGLIKITYFFPEGSAHDGRLWLIYLLAVTKMTDVGGLFIGRFFGKRKLLEKVSPNKTVEGALGGVLFATITSVCFTSALGLSFVQSVLLGIILSLFAEIGDLAESLLKRDAGIKDSNPGLPGLGGFLDIVDSLLLTTPVVYLFLHIWTSLS